MGVMGGTYSTHSIRRGHTSATRFILTPDFPHGGGESPLNRGNKQWSDNYSTVQSRGVGRGLWFSSRCRLTCSAYMGLTRL